MKKSFATQSFIIILTFLVAYYGNKVFPWDFKPVITGNANLRLLWVLAWWTLPTLIITGFLFGFRNLAGALGINRSPLKGLAFAAITVWPILVSSALIAGFELNVEVNELIRKTLFAGFIEEYMFRGFLFGILFRKVGWGFISAGLLGALFFGMGHIYQGGNFTQSLGIFLITAMGALWFAWLYIEWNNNLWIPIFLHILMNLSWSLFDVSQNALGDVYLNIFRTVTIALSVILTIRQAKRNGFHINKGNLWVNSVIN